MPDIAAKGISYVLGICNSFVWNKYWTFSARGSERGKREFAVFFAVNIPPLVVNVVVFTLLGLWIDAGTFWVRMAKAFAAAVVSVAWNFLGSRYLAFRHTALKGGMGPGWRRDRGTARRKPASPARPRYSIVIPIHNEAECLAAEVAELVGELEAPGVDYELLLAENGSSDETPAIAEAWPRPIPASTLCAYPCPTTAPP